MPRVFICYSRKDAKFVDRLTADLRAAGVPTWRDQDDIPGDELSNKASWRRAVDRALVDCTHMVVVLSPYGVASTEVEAEWNDFVNAGKPVYPVVCRECRVPYRLNILNWWDLRQDYEDRVKRLAALILKDIGPSATPAGEPATTPPPAKPPAPKPLPGGQAIAPWATVSPEQQALLDTMLDTARPPEERAEAGRKLAELGDPRAGVGLRPDGLPDVAWCEVPAGKVVIEDGIGQQAVAAFRIAKYPVTYTQYRAFVDAPDGYGRLKWWLEPVKLAQRQPQPGEQGWPLANHPAENASWYDAVAFCRWLTDCLRSELPGGAEVRLPTEAEWQLAAGGPWAWEYPWGTDYAVGDANVYETSAGVAATYLDRTTAVGVYPQGAAQCGALDMAGNVWEWTLSEHEDGSSADLKNDRPRVFRGGSWVDHTTAACAWSRPSDDPGYRSGDCGFRVVLAAPVR